MAQLNIQLNEFRNFFISLGPYNTTLAELNRKYKNPLNLGDATIAVSGNFMCISLSEIFFTEEFYCFNNQGVNHFGSVQKLEDTLFSHKVLENIDR